MMLRGLPFIYQGQEIGMENCAFKNIEEMDDLNSGDEYRVALAAGCTEEQAMAAVQRYSRDNCRTPFQWNAGTEAGFYHRDALAESESQLYAHQRRGTDGQSEFCPLLVQAADRAAQIGNIWRDSCLRRVPRAV